MRNFLMVGKEPEQIFLIIIKRRQKGLVV